MCCQVSTSAGWDAVLDGMMVSPPHCNSTTTEVKPNGNCGNAGMAILYLVTYLIITFLVVINMYIAVILENFSQVRLRFLLVFTNTHTVTLSDQEMIPSS